MRFGGTYGECNGRDGGDEEEREEENVTASHHW